MRGKAELLILAGILALALTSVKAPIDLVWVDVAVLGFLKTLFGNFVVWSVDWAFSLLWLLWWHSTKIWVSKPNTNQHNEPVIWVSIFDIL